MKLAAKVGQEWKFTTGTGEKRLYRLDGIKGAGHFAPIIELGRIGQDGTAYLQGERWLHERRGSGHWELVA